MPGWSSTRRKGPQLEFVRNHRRTEVFVLSQNSQPTYPNRKKQKEKSLKRILCLPPTILICAAGFKRSLSNENQRVQWPSAFSKNKERKKVKTITISYSGIAGNPMYYIHTLYIKISKTTSILGWDYSFLHGSNAHYMSQLLNRRQGRVHKDELSTAGLQQHDMPLIWSLL